MVSDKRASLGSELVSPRIIRVLALLTSDRCTSFDTELGCVLSYQDRTRQEAESERHMDVLERVLVRQYTSQRPPIVDFSQSPSLQYRQCG